MFCSPGSWMQWIPWHGLMGPWGGLLGLLVFGLLVWLVVRAIRRDRPTARHAGQTCHACGAPVEPVFFRCPRCGIDIKTHCPGCCRVVDADWTFCPYCGREAAGNASSQPPTQEGGTS